MSANVGGWLAPTNHLPSLSVPVMPKKAVIVLVLSAGSAINQVLTPFFPLASCGFPMEPLNQASPKTINPSLLTWGCFHLALKVSVPVNIMVEPNPMAVPSWKQSECVLFRISFLRTQNTLR